MQRMMKRFEWRLLFSFAMVAAATVHAQEPLVVPAGDVGILLDALNFANANGQPTVVELEPGTYTLTAVHNTLYGPNGLPPVLEDLTIEGNGAVIERDPAAPPFRFFAVPNPADGSGLSSGRLTLRNLTLRGGLARGGRGGDGFGGGGGAGLGGAIFCRGELELEGVVFQGNTAQGGDGGIDNFTGIGGGGGGMGGDGGESIISGGGGGGGGMGGNGGTSNDFGGGGGGGRELGEDGVSAVDADGGAGGGTAGGAGGNTGLPGDAGAFGGGGGGGGSGAKGGAGGFGGGSGGSGSSSPEIPDTAGYGGGGGGRGGAGGFGGGGGARGNAPSPGAGGFGGGIGGTFSGGGGGAGLGGAVFLDGATGGLRDCDFFSNSANGGASGGSGAGDGQGLGGAVFSRNSGAVVAEALRFADNAASSGAGTSFDNQDTYGTFNAGLRISLGDVEYRVTATSPATCLQVPIYLENNSDDFRYELTELRFAVRVPDQPGTVAAPLSQPMLVVNAFADAGAGTGTTGLRQPPVLLGNSSPGVNPDPSCAVVRNMVAANPDEAIDFPAGFGNAVWTTTNVGGTGDKHASAEAGGAVFGEVLPYERLLVGVLHVPIVAQPSVATFNVELLQNPLDNLDLVGFAGFAYGPDKGLDPEPMPVAGALMVSGPATISVFPDIVSCSAGSIMVSDNLDGETGGAMVSFKYRDPALGGVGGSATVTINHPTGVDRLDLYGESGFIKSVTPTGTQTTATLTTVADGWPVLGVEFFELAVSFVTEYPPGSGTFYDDGSCGAVHRWEPATCELIVSPGLNVTSGTAVSFEVVLRNVRLEGGNYGFLRYQDDASGLFPAVATLTAPGTALNETLTFFNAFTIPAASVGDNGNYFLDFNTPASIVLGDTCNSYLSVDGPTDITLTGNTVEENRPAGTPIGVFSSVDANQALGHAYQLVSGEGSADNSDFQIDGAILRTSRPLDYEQNPVRSIRVRSTDDDGGRFEKVFSIEIIDIDEPATVVGLSRYGIQEGLPAGSMVGAIELNDPEGDTDYTVTLIAGAGDADNANFVLDGDVLRTAVVLDQGEQEFHQIRLRADQASTGFFAESAVIVYVTEPLLWDNAYIVTNPGQGSGGADASDAQMVALGIGTLGFTAGNGVRLADDFEVTAPGGWRLDRARFFAYETNSATTSTMSAATLRIWDGPPDGPASSIVFGDMGTNRLIETDWTGVYRVPSAASLSSVERPVMRVEAGFGDDGVVLPPGTYWVDFSIEVSPLSGPFVPPQTVLGRWVFGGNAMQYVDANWGVALTEGNSVELPFRLYGERLNTAPVFTSTPVETATVGVPYVYDFTAEDPDGPLDPIGFSAPVLPAWLDFVDNGDGTGSIFGTPTEGNIGDWEVRLRVDNEPDNPEFAEQSFTLVVSPAGEGEGDGEGLPEGEGEGDVEGLPEGEGDGEGAPEGEGTPEEHSADQNGDGVISLSELLRVIQFFNSGGYHCVVAPATSEDGYLPGVNVDARACLPHASDYNPQDWVISLSELLRLIQFFNSGGYFPCDSGEDGFCPGVL